MKKTNLAIPQIILIIWVLLCVICFASVRASAQMPARTRVEPSFFPDSSFFDQNEKQYSLLADSSGKMQGFPKNFPESNTTSFSTMSAHKYLGYGTLALAAMAAVTNSSHEIHRAASYAATWLAGATCATGFAGYGNAIDLTDGISANDIHAISGVIGTAAFVATLILAEADKDSGHGAIGAASAAALGISVVAVKIEW
jgi:hypothetical protein